MIVVDASVVLDLLLRAGAVEAIEEHLFRSFGGLHAPHLLDVEVAQVIRRHALRRTIGSDRAQLAMRDMASLPVIRHSHEILLPRIWDLRHNLTTYDAAYVALAEALDAPLLTRDQGIAGSQGIMARVILV